jgi:AcrR family transcriptional regulator
VLTSRSFIDYRPPDCSANYNQAKRSDSYNQDLMGHKYSREQILAGAVELVLDGGLSSLSYGQLAKSLGTSDRVIVYYFPSKQTLIGETLAEIGTRLQEALARAFAVPASDHRELTAAAFPLLANDEMDPIFAVYFEACGLAAAGLEPYGQIADELVQAWIGWLAGFLVGTPQRRRAEAEATLALIDGVLLLRQLGGPAAAARAAKALGLR